MFEALIKRKNCRNFLKAYSEELYKEVIPYVFEIGVLSLERSFERILFTKEEFCDIIDDLLNSNYFKNRKTKKIQKLNGIENNAKGNNYFNKNLNRMNSCTNIHSNNLLKNSPFSNNINPNNVNNLSNINNMGAIDNPSNTNIYPPWWNKDKSKTSIDYQKELNNQLYKKNHHKKHYNINFNSSQSQTSNLSHSCSDNSCSYCHPENTDYFQHKSKPLIMNKLKKCDRPPINNNEEQIKNKNRINYKIEYDKNLNVESIEKKSKDPNKLKYSISKDGLNRTPSIQRNQSADTSMSKYKEKFNVIHKSQSRKIIEESKEENENYDEKIKGNLNDLTSHYINQNNQNIPKHTILNNETKPEDIIMNNNNNIDLNTNMNNIVNNNSNNLSNNISNNINNNMNSKVNNDKSNSNMNSSNTYSNKFGDSNQFQDNQSFAQKINSNSMNESSNSYVNNAFKYKSNDNISINNHSAPGEQLSRIEVSDDLKKIFMSRFPNNINNTSGDNFTLSRFNSSSGFNANTINYNNLMNDNQK